MTIIAKLTTIVSSIEPKIAEKNILDSFKHIGVSAATNIRKDVQDFIDGVMSESELIHHLKESGVS